MRRALLIVLAALVLAPAVPAHADDLCVDTWVTTPGQGARKFRVCVPY